MPHSTPAAWGRYSEKTGGLSIANHELGVVVRLTQEDLEAEGSFLATWKRPLQKYGPKDTPWVGRVPSGLQSVAMMLTRKRHINRINILIRDRSPLSNLNPGVSEGCSQNL